MENVSGVIIFSPHDAEYFGRSALSFDWFPFLIVFFFAIVLAGAELSYKCFYFGDRVICLFLSIAVLYILSLEGISQ